jgi:uncharacterized protein (DUF58 family)
MAPGGRLAVLAALGVPVALADGGSGLLWGAVATFNVALLLGAVLDARGVRLRAPVVERLMDTRLVVGTDNRVTLRLHNRSARLLHVVIRDDLPQGWQAEPEEMRITLPAWARRDVHYVVRPPTRGVHHFGDVHLRLEGRSRLGAARVRVDAARESRVYPNVLGPSRYDALARLGELRHAGFRNSRLMGGGGEFEQLREYVQGDPYRDVDWKSTARRHRPVTRVHQQERSQRVILCIDAGRMMAMRLDQLTKLDHAINAALLLGHVALRQGDQVGLIVFAEGVHAFVPPRSGPAQYRRLLEALFRVEAAETAVDFRRLAEHVRTRVPRRSLLVVFSDLLDETHAMPLAEHAAVLRRKHLPVCVTLDDPVARTLADAEVHSVEGVYRRAAAGDLLSDREVVKAHLIKAGVGLVEAPAGALAVATVNRYMELKARRVL